MYGMETTITVVLGEVSTEAKLSRWARVPCLNRESRAKGCKMRNSRGQRLVLASHSSLGGRSMYGCKMLIEWGQNLIPLILFRPLRLCVPADQLRNARIILLRVTHIIYVVAIWLYEGGSRYWNNKRDEWQQRAGAHKRSLFASRVSLSHKAPKYLAVRNRSEASLMAKVPGSGSHNQFVRDSDALADMKKILDKLNTQEEMIKKLSRQLDELPVPHPPSPKA